MSEYIERGALKAMFLSNNKPLETAICSVIDAVLAADVAPVVHGEWIAKGSLGVCPLCGEYVKIKSRYCPECVRTWADRNGDRLQPSGEAMLTLIDEIHRQNVERRHGHE